MKEILKTKCDNMLNLFEEIQKEFKWENSYFIHLIALIYIQKNKDFSREKIKDVIKVIKNNTGIFSSFRSKLFVLASLLCSEYDNPQDKAVKMIDYHKMLREEGFKNSTYLPIAAYTLLFSSKDKETNNIVKKAYDIFLEIKKNHPWLTSGDDYPLCILLAQNNKSVSESIKDIENCFYNLNRQGFSKGNGLQLLSHILSFSSESNKEICDKCKNVYDRLKINKIKTYSTYYSALGLIALLDDESNKIVDDVVDVVNYLKTLKKFKWLGKGMNLLIASGLVSDNAISSANNKELFESTASISIEVIVAAQTSAIIAGVVASSAAVSSAN